MSQPPLLHVQDLHVHFKIKPDRLLGQPATLRAVDGISFSLERGQSLGIVGESGCGKTSAALALVGLTKPTSGDILVNGMPMVADRRERKALAQQIQLVFQDPYSSLNPRMTVGDALRGPLLLHGLNTREDVDEAVGRLLTQVGLRPEHAARYPHEFSGGQRQRIGIARALALRPAILVGDEPVSALDVSVQAQILNLLLELQQTLGLSLVIISHNLAVIEHLCDKIVVMYLGRIVEQGSYADVTAAPRHPYTPALIAAAPGGERTGERVVLQGDLPSPLDPPPGCPFNPRCPRATDICRQEMPVLASHSPSHTVACHHA